jgi:hypothetical protein
MPDPLRSERAVATSEKDLFNAELITEDDNGEIVLTAAGEYVMNLWTAVLPKHGFC